MSIPWRVWSPGTKRPTRLPRVGQCQRGPRVSEMGSRGGVAPGPVMTGAVDGVGATIGVAGAVVDAAGAVSVAGVVGEVVVVVDAGEPGGEAPGIDAVGGRVVAPVVSTTGVVAAAVAGAAGTVVDGGAGDGVIEGATGTVTNGDGDAAE